LLTSGKLTQAELRRGLVAAGLLADRDTVSGLHAEARAHLTRYDIEQALRGELTALGPPLVELPYLPGGVDRAELDELAVALGRAGSSRAGTPPDTLG
jgi:hypothetical protein